MKLDQLSEIIWNFYNQGRSQATNRSFSIRDVLEFTKMAVAGQCRSLYFEYKKQGEREEFYFSSPLLSVKRFELPDPDERNMRRVDMDKWEILRLPREYDIPNIYPVGSCADVDAQTITLVAPGEENFYRKPKFADVFRFGVVKGRGINLYNIPLCVTNVDVEATFMDDGVDVPMDIAFASANIVLGVTLEIPGFVAKNVDNAYSPQQQSLKHAIGKQPVDGQV